MAKLFDTGSGSRRADVPQESPEQLKAKVDRVAQMFAKYEATSDEEKSLGQMLASAPAVQSIRYETYRVPGRPWIIEHGRDGDDYVYQLFPLKQTSASWQDTIAGMIAAMDVIFPRSTQIKYAPPNPQYKADFFTVRVEAVTKLPGWESACRERALRSLVSVNA